MAKFFSRSPEKNFLVKLCEGVITVTVALIFLLVPAFFTGLAVQGFVFEKLILFYLLTLLALVAWVTRGVAEGELTITRTPLDLPLWGLAIVLFVSSFFSVDPLASFVGSFGAVTKTFIAFIIYLAFYYLVVNTITERRIRVFAWSLVTGGAAVIGYSALQISGIFVLPLAITQTTSFNPVGSASSLAVFVAGLLPLLAIAAPALLGESKTAFKKTADALLRALLALVVIVGLFVLFLLNNFVFWPAAIIGMVVVMMFVLSQVVALKQADMAVPMVVFLVLIIFLVGGNFNLVTAQLPAEVSLTRGLSWQITKQSLKNDPLLGSGPATFEHAFAKYRGPDFNASDLWNVRFDTPQGAAFELLTTTGILGFFGFLTIALILGSIVFLSLTKVKDTRHKHLLLGLSASMTVLALNALVATTSGTIVLTLVLCVVLGASLVIREYPERFKEVRLSFRSSPQYALALAALFLLVSAGVVVLFTSGFKVYLADYYALKAVQSADSEAAVNYLNRAIATADYQDQYYLRLSRLYVGLANQEAQKGQAANVTTVQNYLSLAITAGKQAVERVPNSVVNKESIALLYENAAGYNISGALEWAEKYYTDVIGLEPDNPAAYVRLALINMAYAARESAEEERTHFYDEAVNWYTKAIAKKANLAPAYYGIAITYERKGDYALAVERLAQAVSIAPANIDYRFELGRMLFNRGVSSQSAQSSVGSEPDASETGADDETGGADEQPAAEVGANEDLQAARAIFENILTVSPRHANTLYSLALLHETLGEREQTIDYYERLLDVVGDQPTKDAILEKLRSL